MRKQEYLFNGIIWSIKTDAAYDSIALEIRHKDRKEVEFFTIDLFQKKQTKILHDFEDKWLWGMEALHHKVLILYSYTSSQSPQHQYLVAYDANTGEKKWENYTDAFEDIYDDHLLTYNLRIEPKQYKLINIITGDELRVIKDIKPVTRNPKPEIFFPEYSEVLQQETCEHKGYRVRSFIRDNKQFIEIIHHDKKINIQEMISEDIDTLPLDTFFIFNNYILFIKNKSELVSYLLE